MLSSPGTAQLITPPRRRLPSKTPRPAPGLPAPRFPQVLQGGRHSVTAGAPAQRSRILGHQDPDHHGNFISVSRTTDPLLPRVPRHSAGHPASGKYRDPRQEWQNSRGTSSAQGGAWRRAVRSLRSSFHMTRLPAMRDAPLVPQDGPASPRAPQPARSHHRRTEERWEREGQGLESAWKPLNGQTFLPASTEASQPTARNGTAPRNAVYRSSPGDRHILAAATNQEK